MSVIRFNISGAGEHHGDRIETVRTEKEVLKPTEGGTRCSKSSVVVSARGSQVGQSRLSW